MMMRIVPVLLVAAAVFGSKLMATAAPGDLDPSLAGSGMLRIGFGHSDDHGRAVASQPDGKIVMAGVSSSLLTVIRLDTNNVLDATFGTGGVARLESPTYPEITEVGIQPDGKIVVAGWIHGTTPQYSADFFLARFHADGAPDTSFDQDGVLIRSYGHRDECNALVIQSDGRIVVGGITETPSPGTVTSMVIARLLDDGSPDLSFAGDGSIVETNSSRLHSLMLQGDGKLLVGGSVGSSMSGLLRFNANGTLDTNFGTNGKAHIQLGPAAIAIQPADIIQSRPERIVVAGYFSWGGQQGVKVARLSMDGKLDSTFNSTGSVFKVVGSQVTVSGISGGYPQRFQRQILVGGHYQNGATKDFMLVRFTDAGLVDTTFGIDGIKTQSLTDNQDEAFDMMMQPGFKVVLAGTSRITIENHDFALARFNWGDGSLDTNFNGAGVLLQNVGDRAAKANCVAVQADGKIVTGGNCEVGYSRNAVALCRLHPDGTFDQGFGEAGRVISPIGEDGSEASAMAIQPDGRIVIAGILWGDFDSRDTIFLARYLPGGTLDSSFGSNGVVITVIGTNGATPVAIALQPDAKIVVGGRIRVSDSDFLVMRYHPDGSLDNTWNGNGKVITGIGPNEDELHDITIQPDGKIMAVGGSVFTATGKFTAVRYNMNGSMDASFGTFGRLATQLGSAIYDVAHAVLLVGNGKFVLGGFSAAPPQYNLDAAYVRYDAGGGIDATFDGDGMMITPIGLAEDYVLELARQSDGKIVAACRTQMGTYHRFAAMRLSPTGSIDSGFGFGGVNYYDFGTGGEETLNDMAMDSRNRMVMVGEVGGLFGILRVQSDPILRVNSVTRLANGHVLLHGEGVPGAMHTLQKSATLASGGFFPAAPVTTTAAGEWYYEDSNTSESRGFYRLSYP